VLAGSPHDISVAAVIRAVEDGPLLDVRGEAVDDLRYPGPAADLPGVWRAAEASLLDVLESVSIADVAGGRVPPPRCGRAPDERASPSVDVAGPAAGQPAGRARSD
jgi:DNA-binding IscR family transcriptional regulator